MKNLRYHFPTCYAYSVKRAYRGTKPEESFDYKECDSDQSHHSKCNDGCLDVDEDYSN